MVHLSSHLCRLALAFGLVFLCSVISSSEALKKDDCEVCITVMDRFSASLDSEVKKDPKAIEAEYRKYCAKAKGREERLCYYLGGVKDSATGILGEMSKPMSWGLPGDKICEKLKKKDAQICELRYEKMIDLKTVELKKLKVRDLKKILNDWNEECDGCIEKGDFIKRIEELKPQYMRNEL